MVRGRRHYLIVLSKTDYHTVPTLAKNTNLKEYCLALKKPAPRKWEMGDCSMCTHRRRPLHWSPPPTATWPPPDWRPAEEGKRELWSTKKIWMWISISLLQCKIKYRLDFPGRIGKLNIYSASTLTRRRIWRSPCLEVWAMKKRTVRTRRYCTGWPPPVWPRPTATPRPSPSPLSSAPPVATPSLSASLSENQNDRNKVLTLSCLMLLEERNISWLADCILGLICFLTWHEPRHTWRGGC